MVVGKGGGGGGGAEGAGAGGRGIGAGAGVERRKLAEKARRFSNMAAGAREGIVRGWSGWRGRIC